MIIYNVTVKVDNEIAEAYLQWLQQEHIPEVLQTGCFVRHTVLELMETEDSDGTTYAIQYYAESKADVNRYLERYAPEMRSRGTSRWGNRFIAFRSIMKVIN